MEILLLEDVTKLGRRGQVVKVADGYARNFLIPKKFAVKINAKNKKMLDNERIKIEIQNRKRKLAQQLLAENIQKLELEFVARAHEGLLYGSISVNDILEKLMYHGFKVDAKQVLLEENIKQIGTHSIPVRLRDGVEASLTVHVISEE